MLQLSRVPSSFIPKVGSLLGTILPFVRVEMRPSRKRPSPRTSGFSGHFHNQKWAVHWRDMPEHFFLSTVPLQIYYMAECTHRLEQLRHNPHFIFRKLDSRIYQTTQKKQESIWFLTTRKKAIMLSNNLPMSMNNFLIPRKHSFILFSFFLFPSHLVLDKHIATHDISPAAGSRP